METCGKLDGQLHRPIVDDGTALELCHTRSLTFVRLQHEVAVNDHADRKTWADR